MKKRDIYFILLMVFVVAFLGFMSRIRRFKRIPADAYHKELNAPDDCVQCHQHPKGWSMPSPPPPDLTIPVARRRPVPAAHPSKFQCLRCHEYEKKK